MIKNNKFISICIICGSLLLVLIYFGINKYFVNDTYAAQSCSCPNGGSLQGTSCVVVTSHYEWVEKTISQSCSSASVPSNCTFTGNNMCVCTGKVQVEVSDTQTYAASCVNVPEDIGPTCEYASEGHCKGATGKTCIYQNGCYVPPALVNGDTKACSAIKGSLTGGQWIGSCTYVNGEWLCPSCFVQCFNGYTLEGNQCVPCSGEDCKECDQPACYVSGSNYCWGTSKECSGSLVNTIGSANDCKAPTSGGTTGGTTPSNPTNPSVPGASTNPSTPSTGAPSSSVPTDGNITENPPTGAIAVFMIWIIGVASIVYSVWYFKRIKEN